MSFCGGSLPKNPIVNLQRGPVADAGHMRRIAVDTYTHAKVRNLIRVCGWGAQMHTLSCMCTLKPICFSTRKSIEVEQWKAWGKRSQKKENPKSSIGTAGSPMETIHLDNATRAATCRLCGVDL